MHETIAVTLRCLTTTDSYNMRLSYLFKISKQSILDIMPEVFIAIIDVLKDFIMTSKTYFLCIFYELSDNRQ